MGSHEDIISVLRNKEIDLNKEASDIITEGYFSSKDSGENKILWQNLKTGKTSERWQDIIRPGRRFLAMKKKRVEGGLLGYYAIQDKENNALIIVNAKFEEGIWLEMCRHIFYWQDDALHYDGNDDFLGEKAVDVCGQTFVSKYDMDKRDIQKNPALDGLSREAYISFFKEAYIETEAERPMLENNNIEMLAWYCRTGRKKITRKKEAFLPLPEEGYEALKNMALKILLAYGHMDVYIQDDICVSALTSDSSQAVIQFFSAYPVYTYPFEDSTLILVCGKQKDVNEKMDYYMTASSQLAYVDMKAMKYTCLSYTAYIIDEKAKELAGKPEDEISYDISTGYGKKSMADALMLACMLAQHPILEKMYKIKEPYADAARKFLSNPYELYLYSVNRTSYPEWTFGKLYKGKTIDRMLGLPEGMFRAVCEINEVQNIKYIKEVFEGDSREFFLRLDKDSIKEVARGLSYAAADQNRDVKDDIKEILQILFALRGCKEWRSYMRHINRMPCADFPLFKEYLYMLFAIGEPAKDADWKLSGEALEKAACSLREAYNVTAREGKRAVIDLKIKGRQKDLLEFCYEDNGFVIYYPEDSGDIIKEGVALHHCAKDFISAVAEKKTTLLFIRKQDKPDKPFYTLEIRDNGVRQCHGFDNCNIYDVDGLEEFLISFCKEKGIEFRDGSLLCPV